MKFLLDVCAASRLLLTTLADLGHDVLSARDRFPHASHQALLTPQQEMRKHRLFSPDEFAIALE